MCLFVKTRSGKRVSRRIVRIIKKFHRGYMRGYHSVTDEGYYLQWHNAITNTYGGRWYISEKWNNEIKKITGISLLIDRDNTEMRNTLQKMIRAYDAVCKQTHDKDARTVAVLLETRALLKRLLRSAERKPDYGYSWVVGIRYVDHHYVDPMMV